MTLDPERPIVLLILTRDGLNDMQQLMAIGGCFVWVNGGVISEAQANAMRASGVELTLLSQEIEPSDDDAITAILGIIAEHHPVARVWVEFQSGEIGSS